LRAGWRNFSRSSAPACDDGADPGHKALAVVSRPHKKSAIVSQKPWRRGTGIGLSSRNETARCAANRSGRVRTADRSRPDGSGRADHPRPDRPRPRPRPGAFLDGLAEGLVLTMCTNTSSPATIGQVRAPTHPEEGCTGQGALEGHAVRAVAHDHHAAAGIARLGDAPRTFSAASRPLCSGPWRICWLLRPTTMSSSTAMIRWIIRALRGACSMDSRGSPGGTFAGPARVRL
jgi:hypothetical protein